MTAASNRPGPEPGDQAPDFDLPADDGTRVSLAALRGQRVILYFYPRDATPGCTTQACDFRDNWERIHGTGTVVYGVSPDGIASHQRFRTKQELPFHLLVDEAHQVAEAYGVWREKRRFGRRYHGMVRTTFGIDQRGVVRMRLEQASGAGHAAAALEWLAGKEG